MTTEQVETVRRFHRLVTQRSGALEDHFLGRERPLGATRVLYEIGSNGSDLRALRERLGLDSGYLSRIVQSLAAEKLVLLRSGEGDERVRRVELTRRGRAEIDEINARSEEAAEALLETLTPPQRERLVAAMDEVHRLLRISAVHIERVEPQSPAAQWCMSQYFAELSIRFEFGFDASKSLPTDDDQLRPPHGAFLVAIADGEPVACGLVKRVEPHIGYLKRMWVAESARGLGFGSRMLRALEEQSRELGFTTVRLETNRALSEAISLYRRAGYVEVQPFNNERYADYWFEKQLT